MIRCTLPHSGHRGLHTSKQHLRHLHGHAPAEATHSCTMKGPLLHGRRVSITLAMHGCWGLTCWAEALPRRPGRFPAPFPRRGLCSSSFPATSFPGSASALAASLPAQYAQKCLFSCPSFCRTVQCQIWPAKGDMNSRGEKRQTEERSPPAQELWPWSGLPLLRFTMSISWSAAELEVAGVWPTLPSPSPAYI